MWLTTKNSFVSIVQHRTLSDCVLVRARRKKDLVKLFPDKKKHVKVDEMADYKYRLVVKRAELTGVVTDYITHQLTYDNFKANQEPDDPAWMTFLHSVWGAGFTLQK